MRKSFCPTLSRSIFFSEPFVVCCRLRRYYLYHLATSFFLPLWIALWEVNGTRSYISSVGHTYSGGCYQPRTYPRFWNIDKNELVAAHKLKFHPSSPTDWHIVPSLQPIWPLSILSACAFSEMSIIQKYGIFTSLIPSFGHRFVGFRQIYIFFS